MRSQGVTEELKCLSLLNALHKDPDIPEQLAQLLGEPCMKLAEGIKAYISKVRETFDPSRNAVRAQREHMEVGFRVNGSVNGVNGGTSGRNDAGPNPWVGLIWHRGGTSIREI